MVDEEGGREFSIWTSTELDNLRRGNLKKKEKKKNRAKRDDGTLRGATSFLTRNQGLWRKQSS